VGVDGLRLHDWILATPTFAGTYGCAGTNSAGPGYTGAADGGLDDEIVAAAEVGIGATIMGRNMFGPVRARGVIPGQCHRNSGRVGGETNDLSITRFSC